MTSTSTRPPRRWERGTTTLIVAAAAAIAAVVLHVDGSHPAVVTGCLAASALVLTGTALPRLAAALHALHRLRHLRPGPAPAPVPAVTPGADPGRHPG